MRDCLKFGILKIACAEYYVVDMSLAFGKGVMGSNQARSQKNDS